MDTKRRTVALTLAVALAASLGLSTAALAAHEEAVAGLIGLGPAHDGDGPGDNSDESTDGDGVDDSKAGDGSNPGDDSNPGDIGDPGGTGDPGDTAPGEIGDSDRSSDDRGDSGPCTSVNSGVPFFGPTTVCTGEHPG